MPDSILSPAGSPNGSSVRTPRARLLSLAGASTAFSSTLNAKYTGHAEEEEEEAQISKSLRLSSDPRFKEIQHFMDTQASEQSHFARLCGRNQSSSAGEDTIRIASPKGPNTMEEVKDELDNTGMDDCRVKSKGIGSLGERVEWQECFDKSVKRLLIDFDLTAVPSCRLNHLDRMHEWFTNHGGKQTRKAKQPPAFLTADRSVDVPAGSTANITGKLSGTSLMLAGAFQLKCASKGNSGSASNPGAPASP